MHCNDGTALRTGQQEGNFLNSFAGSTSAPSPVHEKKQNKHKEEDEESSKKGTNTNLRWTPTSVKNTKEWRAMHLHNKADRNALHVTERKVGSGGRPHREGKGRQGERTVIRKGERRRDPRRTLTLTYPNSKTSAKKEKEGVRMQEPRIATDPRKGSVVFCLGRRPPIKRVYGEQVGTGVKS